MATMRGKWTGGRHGIFRLRINKHFEIKLMYEPCCVDERDGYSFFINGRHQADLPGTLEECQKIALDSFRDLMIDTLRLFGVNI